MKFRRLNRWYANYFRYFWLPCTLCGKMFGGHEWKDRKGLSSVIKTEDCTLGQMRGICPDCTLAGKGHDRWEAFK